MLNIPTVVRAIVAGAVLLSLFIASTRAEEPPAFRRWAIVATEEVQRSGLSDLIFTRLAEHGELELVEREQLATVLREIELSQCFGAGNTAARLKLGARLKADALLLLSRKQHPQGDSLELVISESQAGARLYFDYLPYDAARPETMADACTTHTLRTYGRFAHGIGTLVAVPPFVSRDLSHRFDALQVGFAQALQQGLGQYPGTAVVEVEEARAIAAELAGENVKDRIVPVMIEGDFSSTPAQNGRPAQLTLQIRVRDGDKILRETEHKNLAQAEAVALLSGEVPRFVVQASALATPLSAEAQIASLTARADRFSRVGAWRHAFELREAALLIDPQQPDQRRRAIAEYLEFSNNSVLQRMPGNLEQFTSDQLAWWLPMLGHLEYLVRNKHERGAAATTLFREIYWAGCTRGWYRVSPNEVRWPKEMVNSRDEFFWRVFPLIAEPDSTFAITGLSLISISRKSHTTAIEGYIEDVFDERDLFGQLERFIIEICPPKLLTDQALRSLFIDGAHDWVLHHRFSAKEVEQFLLRMRAMKQPAVQHYACVALWRLKIYHMEPAETVAELRDEVDALMKMSSGDTRTTLIVARRELERRASAGVNGRLAALKPKEPEVYHSYEEVTQRPPQVVNKDRPAKTKLTLRLVPEIKPEWLELLQCGPKLDLMWNHHHVWRMEQPGKEEKIFSVDPRNSVIFSAVWDDQHLWLATNDRGILVISPAGKVVQTMSAEHGLPEYIAKLDLGRFGSRQGLMLHAIAPGKCLAVGRIGEHHRVWYAMVSFNPADLREVPKVNVFHECAHIVPESEHDAGDALDRTHIPCWISEIPASSGSERQILVGGYPVPNPTVGGFPPTYRPLVIEPQTLKVSRFPGALPQGAGFYPPLSLALVKDGILSAMTLSVIYSHPNQGDSSGAWTSERLISNPVIFEVGSVQARPLLAYKGKLYWPNPIWYRIDPETRKFERLQQDPLPPYQRCNRFGVSTHLGLVAWRDSYGPGETGIPHNARQELFQVIVDE